MPSSKKVRLNIEVSPQQRKILKKISTELETSLTSIARAVFDDYIKACLNKSDLPAEIKEQIRAYLRE